MGCTVRGGVPLQVGGRVLEAPRPLPGAGVGGARGEEKRTSGEIQERPSSTIWTVGLARGSERDDFVGRNVLKCVSELGFWSYGLYK
eukprot:7074196-Pyramimonas_sp.AAC.1